MRFQFFVPVHWSAWAQQPSVRIECDQTFSTPAWGKHKDDLPMGVHRLDDGRLYTFDDGKVTCEACLAVMVKQEPKR